MAWKALGGDNRRFVGKKAALLDGDDLFSRRLTLAIEDAGGSCRRVPDADELLRLIRAGDADFAIVASDLPEDGCPRVLSTIRSDPSSHGFPVVVLATELTETRGFDLYSRGADLVLLKALDQQLLNVLLGPAD